MSNAETQLQIQRGLALHRQNQIGLAQSHYQRAVKLDPKNADAWQLLGLAAFQLELIPKAIKHFRQALALRPSFAEAWNNLAIALKREGKLVEAAEHFAKALEIRPEYVEAAHNLAILRESQGDFAAAEAAYKRALIWRPEAVDSLSNLGNLMRLRGDLHQAKAILAKAYSIAPNASTAINYALVLTDLGDYRGAKECAEFALAHEPDALEPLRILGAIARLQNDLGAALPLLRTLCQRAPSADALLELALSENAAGDYERALACLAQAQKLAPESERIRWINAFLLPSLITNPAQAQFAVDRFEASLSAFEAQPREYGQARALLEALLSCSSFELAYLPQAKIELAQRFASLIESCVAGIRSELALPAVQCALPVKTTRLRVGIVSSYLREHTVMRYFGAFFQALAADPEVELFVYFSGEAPDVQTAKLASQATYYVHAAWPFLQTVAEIKAAELDVLIFPDVGMDAQQHLFLAWRLARHQVVLYGHPQSSWMHNADLYLSAAALEPPQAQSHYRERLLCLPALGAYPTLPSAPPKALGSGASEAVLLCTQNLSKLTPEFDQAVCQILQGSGARLQLVDRITVVSERYLQRLSSQLQAHGITLDRVQLVPARDYTQFLELIARADLVLDSPWFSGGATSLDSLSVGTPVLSWQAPYARGRQTAGMLNMLGLGEELLATDASDFANRALALIAAPARREALRARLAGRGDELLRAEVIPAFMTAIKQLHAA